MTEQSSYKAALERIAELKAENEQLTSDLISYRDYTVGVRTC